MIGSDLNDVEHLGDGCYVGHDGHQVWVFASDGERVLSRVAMEPGVLQNFDRWRQKYPSHFKPRGRVKHKDGDPTNNEIDNLEIVYG